MTPAPQRLLPLERRLPLVLATVLLATLGFALFVTHRVLVRGAEQNAAAGLLSAVGAIVGNLENTTRQRGEQLSAVARAPALRELLAAPGGASRQARERAGDVVEPLLGREGREAVVQLVDPQGAVVARWGDGLPEAVTALGRQLPRGEPRDTPWATPVVVMDGHLHSGVAVGIRDEHGRPAGILSVMRRGSGQAEFSRLLRGLTGQEVTAYFGNVGEAVRPGLPGRVAAQASPDTTPRVATRAGVGSVLTVTRRVAGTPWITVLEMPLSSVYTEPADITRRLAVLFLVLALTGAAFTWHITRGVTRPIRQLTAATDAVGHGEPPTPVDLDRTDELGQLASSFNAMARQISASRAELERRIVEAERANRAKADFLAMMSHELRTPLNAIAGYTQLIEMGLHGPVTPEQRDALTRIANSQRHLLHLIEDVLSFARLDAGRVEYAFAEVPLKPSIASVLSMVAPQARAKHIALVSQLEDPTLTAYADREKLEQILLNLLANAVKFTPADGRVEIHAEALAQPDAHGRALVEIRVSDTGPGVPATQQEAIFEPFVQGGRALNRPSEGVGLGLAISRDLAGGMGGRLALDRSGGTGASFTVTLLRHAPAVAAGAVLPPAGSPADRAVPV